MPTIKEVACCLEPLVLAQLRKRGVKSPRYSIAGFAFSTSPTSECEEVRADERTRTAYPCPSYEFACVHTSPSYCVRELRLFMRFSMLWRYRFIHRVPGRISPVAVHAWSSIRALDEVPGLG